MFLIYFVVLDTIDCEVLTTLDSPSMAGTVFIPIKYKLP
jgi:hypothetical protein